MAIWNSTNNGNWNVNANWDTNAFPNSNTATATFSAVGVARTTPDYHALVAANMVLGGQFTSRLNMNLRQDKGYTYGARSSFDFRRQPGPFQPASRRQDGARTLTAGCALCRC